MTKDEVAQKVFYTLERIRLVLGLSHKAWADELGVTASQYEREYLGQSDRFPFHSILRISNRLNITPELLIEGHALDMPALVSYYSGETGIIPAKYSVAAYSNVRSLVTLLNFVEKVRGPACRSYVLRMLQTDESALVDLNQPININMITDLLSVLAPMGFKREQYFLMGTNSVVTHADSLLGRALAQQKTPRDLYERQIALSDIYEKNCSWKILRISNTHATIVSKTHEAVGQAFGVKHVSSREGCIVKSGILSSALGFIGLPYATVTHTACVFEGAPSCIYEVDFEAAHYINLKNGRKNQAAAGKLALFRPANSMRSSQSFRYISASLRASVENSARCHK